MPSSGDWVVVVGICESGCACGDEAIASRLWVAKWLPCSSIPGSDGRSPAGATDRAAWARAQPTRKHAYGQVGTMEGAWRCRGCLRNEGCAFVCPGVGISGRAPNCLTWRLRPTGSSLPRPAASPCEVGVFWASYPGKAWSTPSLGLFHVKQ